MQNNQMINLAIMGIGTIGKRHLMGIDTINNVNLCGIIDLTEEQYLINGIRNIRDGVLRKPKSGEIKPQRPLRTSYALKTKNMAYFLVSYFTPYDVPMSRIKQHNYDK